MKKIDIYFYKSLQTGNMIQNTIVSSAHKFHLESAAKDQISGMEPLCIWV